MEESVGVGVKRLHASGDEIWRSVQPAIRIVNHQIPDTLSLNQTLTIKSGPGPLGPLSPLEPGDLGPGHHHIVCLLLRIKRQAGKWLSHCRQEILRILANLSTSCLNWQKSESL